HRPNDDAGLLHFVEDVLPIADADENEVGSRWNEFQSELAKRAGEEPLAAQVKLSGLLDVRRIIERGQRGRLGQSIDIDGLPDLFQLSNEFRMADAVTDAQAG